MEEHLGSLFPTVDFTSRASAPPIGLIYGLGYIPWYVCAGGDTKPAPRIVS